MTGTKSTDSTLTQTSCLALDETFFDGDHDHPNNDTDNMEHKTIFESECCKNVLTLAMSVRVFALSVSFLWSIFTFRRLMLVWGKEKFSVLLTGEHGGQNFD